MTTRLGQRFAPSFSGHPTQLAPYDLALWRRWYAALDPKPIELYFDVGVGEGRPAPLASTLEEKAYWKRVTQKRIDALLVYPDHVKLLELRHDAGPNALGRLLTYRALLREDNPFGVDIETLLVSDNYDRDLAELCKRHRILYEVSLGEPAHSS